MSESRRENWELNKSFSLRVPRLQIALDSTSLGAFKTCPRFYYYSILLGLRRRGPAIDLDFGLAAHRIVELYHKLRFGGASHDEALESVVEDSLLTTWDSEANRPKFDDPQKNRVSLTRLAVWYLDHYERSETGPRTLQLQSGVPAVELSFSFDSGLAIAGEPLLLCGHLDRLVEFNSEIWIPDLKTTRSALGTRYAEQFTPDNQFTLYTLAGKIALGVPTRGVLLDAVQVGTNFVRFARFPIHRPQGILDEWLFALRNFWVPQIQRCAEDAAEHTGISPEQFYPQNDKACSMYGGCTFREVCGRAPRSRKPILEAEFEPRKWDPVGEPR